MMKPLIGITAASYTLPSGWETNTGSITCAKAIEDAGGLPVFIPLVISDASLRALYDRLDGILLPGGGDVRPDRYGQAMHPLTKRIDDARDVVEIRLAQWAADDDRPLFGICRGHQVMNVAFGGTLVQDIPDQVGDTTVHTVPDGTDRSKPLHTVRIDPNSRLAGILGQNVIGVNSIHHQGVDQPGAALSVTAWSPDEVIEAAEMPGKKFVMSVQWHPEDMYKADPTMKRLFEAFVQAAANGAAD